MYETEIFQDSKRFCVDQPGHYFDLSVSAHEVEIQDDFRPWWLLRVTLNDGDFVEVLDERKLLKVNHRPDAIRLAIRIFDGLVKVAPALCRQALAAEQARWAQEV